MSRKQRAKQFAPFDALKGLQNALRIKEYEHERVQRGDVQEEKANEISKTLLSLEKGDVVDVVHYCDGHYLNKTGVAKLFIDKSQIQIDNQKIELKDLYDIKIIVKKSWKIWKIIL